MAIATINGIQIDGMVLGPIQTNVYLLRSQTSCVVIDPADNCDRILAALEGRLPQGIVLTHRHFDHIAALAELVQKSGAQTWAHELDADAIEDPSKDMIEPGFMPAGTRIDHRVSDGDVIEVGDIAFDVLHTPGHTPGGICLVLRDENGAPAAVFCGDTLFHAGVGRTDFPGGSTSDLARSIREKLAPLPDDVLALPGHNALSTIGIERSINRLLQA